MPRSRAQRFLGLPGECAELIRELDWSTTSLGPIDGWPASLTTLVVTLLRSRQPMLLFWGPDLNQLYNDAFVPSLGADKHPSSIGRPAREAWADAWPAIGAQIEAVMSRGEPAWFDEALVPILRNGRMTDVYWTYSYSPVCDDRGEIRGTLVIVTDVTSRVLAARRLRALAAISAPLAAATSDDEMWSALARGLASDVPFAIVVEDGALRAALAIEPERARAVIAEVQAQARDALVPIALASPVASADSPEPVRCVVVASCGRAHLVLGVSPRLPFDDSYRSFLAQLVDRMVSTLRRLANAEASAAIGRERDSLLMHAPVATALMTGPRHTFQLANPSYCRLVGRDPTGRAYLDAFPELRDTPLPAILDRVYRTGVPYVASEQRVPLDRHGTGVIEDCYINFNLEPVREADGSIYGMMAVAVDITAQVQARKVLEVGQEERERVLLALRSADQAKDEFLAMLGHELRNPLAPIVTALDLIERKTHGVERECGVIDRHVRHVIRLVDDLLDVSRITRGQLTLECKILDLADVIAHAVEINAEHLAQHGHRLLVDAPRGMRVLGDEVRLIQVVSNLLTNAGRYTRDPGEIRLTLARRGQRAELTVTDSGIGIAPELLPRIFALFVQGARSADRTEGGLGLGLAIVKTLVEMHGGAVTAHSEGAGRGSSFVVSLPLTEAASAAARSSTASGARPATARRILIVDDNQDAAVMLADLLAMRGDADVEVAHHPRDALRSARARAPDLAILDIGLPDMDGYELASQLAALCPGCRLIALSGYGQEKDRERSRRAGFSAHLVKPVDIAALLAVAARE